MKLIRPPSRTTSGPAVVRMAAPTGQTHDRTRPQSSPRQKVLDRTAPSTHDPKPSCRPLSTACGGWVPGHCHLVFSSSFRLRPIVPLPKTVPIFDRRYLSGAPSVSNDQSQLGWFNVLV